MFRNAVLKFQVVDLFFFERIEAVVSSLIDINKSYNLSAPESFYFCHPTGITSTVMHAVRITNPLICRDGA